jgi:hypothetical protein
LSIAAGCCSITTEGPSQRLFWSRKQNLRRCVARGRYCGAADRQSKGLDYALRFAKGLVSIRDLELALWVGLDAPQFLTTSHIPVEGDDDEAALRALACVFDLARHDEIGAGAERMNFLSSVFRDS